MKNLKIILLALTLIISLISCKKYLDKKPDMRYYIPEKWQDLQALLDNTDLNIYSSNGLFEVIADDIYIADNIWRSEQSEDKYEYIWNSNPNSSKNGWILPYNGGIYTSNVVLDQIDKVINKNETSSVNSVKGSALFFRSLAFYNLAQLFCRPYNPSTSKVDLGLPLKLNGNIEEKISRSNNAETYNQIISDLKKAVEYLPLQVSSSFRPSKLAARALLSRVYLSMSDYINAEAYADEVLLANNVLLDYNTLAPSTNPRVPIYTNNPEIIFMSTFIPSQLSAEQNARIDLSLYNSYEVNDLRKKVFFQANTGSRAGSYRFKGCYFNEGPGWIFNGLSTNELNFIKLECLARRGQYLEAIDMLNNLLKKRYATGTSKIYSATNAQDVLQTILIERRKELIFRGLRWTDIRRLNLAGANITLRRVVDGNTYELPANDLRNTLLIPNDEVIRFGLKQNPR